MGGRRPEDEPLNPRALRRLRQLPGVKAAVTRIGQRDPNRIGIGRSGPRHLKDGRVLHPTKGWRHSHAQQRAYLERRFGS